MRLNAMGMVLFTAVATLTRATPAYANNEIGVRVSTTFKAEDGVYSTGSSNNLVQADLSYAHRLVQRRFMELWLEGAFSIGRRSEAALFGRFDASLLAQQYTVGARLSFPVLRWLIPHVRIGLGAVVGDYSLSDNGTSANDWSAGFTSYALGGTEILIPRKPRHDGRTPVTAGFVAEAGYMFSTAMAFHLSPDQSSDLLVIPSSGVDLGSLNLSGPLLRVGAFLRF